MLEEATPESNDEEAIIEELEAEVMTGTAGVKPEWQVEASVEITITWP